MSSSEGVSDSQTSHVSSLSLGLSQETMNQVMGAVGLNTAMGDRLLEEFHADLDEDEGEEEEEGLAAADSGDGNTTLEGSSTISISRAVFFANSQGSSENSTSQFFPSSPPPPLSTPTNPPHTPASGHSWGSSYAENGVSPNLLLHSPTPPPISQMHLGTTSPLHHLPPAHLPTFHPSQHHQSHLPQFRSNIPQNVPCPGEYGFTLLLGDQTPPIPKSPNLTYSGCVQRMYIKKDAVVPLTFATTTIPPASSVVRALAIHKQPEMIAENVVCCPKHVDEMRKKNKLYPFHFVHSTMENCSYCGDHTTQRLSVTLPLSSLQKTSDRYTALYQFPCFTSDFPRSGQLVQIIFTLECDCVVLGRATMDVRVCASPGRDCSVEERKASQKRGGVSGNVGGTSVMEEEPVVHRRGRKRAGAPVKEEVVQCTFPPKRLCRRVVSSEKVKHTIETYPEIVPHIEECVRLMERVYMVPLDLGGASFHSNEEASGSSQPPSLPRQDSFPSLERWLEDLKLPQYLSLLHRQGVRDTFQAMALTEQELKDWGIQNATHRRRILDSATMLQQDSRQDRRPLTSSQSLSQGSSISMTTQPFRQTFEVLQIQARKKIK